MASDDRPSLQKSHRFQRKGFSYERLIRFFFASNAGLSIVILLLIIGFLLKEGLGFFPGYQRELETYRIAGLEFVDLSRKNLTSHEQLTSVLNRAYYAEINGQSAYELKRSLEASALWSAYNDRLRPARDLILKNPQQQNAENSEMFQKLRERYETEKKHILELLPPTPHLTKEERQRFVESLRVRPLEATGDPDWVKTLASAYAVVKKKHALPLAEFRDQIDAFESAGMDFGAIVFELTAPVTATKEKLQKADILSKDRKTLFAAAENEKDPEQRAKLIAAAEAAVAHQVDVETPMAALMKRRDECIKLHRGLAPAVEKMFKALPQTLTDKEANRYITAASKAFPILIEDLEQTPKAIEAWSHQKPVALGDAILQFFTGKNWVTGGEWQDFYGILPLAVGSLMIAIVALTIAIPVGISAAIYVNQFATKREQGWIKPVIEFIQAIPSVVLGFVGIMVFGAVLREISTIEGLQWIPGFPIEERLNIFTAGCLLAFMAIPTIFSLAEDALNNVPSAYAEASEALGASHIQTTFRVMVPAAFSGILAAVLLGFGRVIGETMVVLLVAGNRIKIPDFSAGLGAFFQPSHTMTGIIAQELGEVPLGSVHYRALFVIAILLFAIVLGINAMAHRFVKGAKK